MIIILTLKIFIYLSIKTLSMKKKLNSDNTEKQSKPKLITLHGSKGFQKLKLFPFNRLIKPRKALRDSIEKYGFRSVIEVIETSLLTGKKELYIADGQNRGCTASFLERDFYAAVFPDFDNLIDLVKYVATQNTTSKPWRPGDYIHAYASIGNHAYNYLQRRINETKYPPMILAQIFLENKLSLEGGSKLAKEAIVSGKFEVKNKEAGEATLSFANEMNSIYKMTGRMVLALHNAMRNKKFNRTRFMNNYRNNCSKLRTAKNIGELFLAWS